MSASPAARPASQSVIAIVLIVLLAIAFAALSYSAALTKSATCDEPLHTVGAYVHRFYDDFRINPEDPPLLGMWAAIPMKRSSLKLDVLSPTFVGTLGDTDNQAAFVVQTLYKTPGVDADAVLNRSRAMFVIAGVILAALIAWWAWKLAGPIAAVMAMALYSFDPNFLGHSPLVKNDVLMSLVTLAAGITVWKVGQRGTALRIAALALVCAAAVNVKFSGVLIGPIVALMLLIRSLMRDEWRVMRWTLRTRLTRTIAAIAICVFAALVSYAVTWHVYGYRYSAVPGDERYHAEDLMLIFANANEVLADQGGTRQPTKEEILAHKPSLTIRTTTWLSQHHALPQAWTFGFLFTYTTTLARTSFLMGQTSVLGFRWFYPLGVLFKTPTGTLALLAFSLIVGVGTWSAQYLKRYNSGDRRLPSISWRTVCLLVPPAIYFAAAMHSNLNIGLRHAFPIYPYLFVIAGVCVAEVQKHRRALAVFASICLVAVACESLSAYPNYIAFFNTPSGGWRGGLKLLSDSNLDWGQDLKQLGQWRQTHRDKPLYLSYFGTADPGYYGIDAVHMFGGWGYALSFHTLPIEHVYVAVSATNLQQMYLPPNLHRQYDILNTMKPITVLGGTIYIYDWPPKDLKGLAPTSQPSPASQAAP